MPSGREGEAPTAGSCLPQGPPRHRPLARTKEAGFTDRSISPRYLRTESAAQHEIYFFVRKGLL